MQRVKDQLLTPIAAPMPCDLLIPCADDHFVHIAQIIDGLAVWDGDIILGTPEELDPCGECAAPAQTLDNPNKTLAVSSKERLWPGGIIPYVIDPELLNPNVLDAIRHWEQNTPIRFV